MARLPASRPRPSGCSRSRSRSGWSTSSRGSGSSPADINYVGISHYHDDHTGQAADFPGATLLIGRGDWEAVKARPAAAARFKPWIDGGAKVEAVGGDKDVFGDQSVVVLAMPGHTPGHKALLVRLKSGTGAADGDLYHATEQVANRGVPSFNTDRADTLASFDRFQAIAKNLGAKVIIQHEAGRHRQIAGVPEGGGVMKALLSHEPGGPDTLRLTELPDPVAGPGELLVRVRAAAINYPDVLIIEDKYQMRPPRPFAPGGEIAGEVEAVGEGVEGWSGRRPADRGARLWRAGREDRHPGQERDPAARQPQLRRRGGAAADLCDLDPRTVRSRKACKRAKRCWCLARPAGSGWRRSSLARRAGRG